MMDVVSQHKKIVDALWIWLLIGALAFFNYAWFFKRNLLDASLLSVNDPWHQQAMTLTYLTIGLCLLLTFLQHRENRKAWATTIGLFFFIALNLIYNPWVSPHFKVVPLEIVDWLYAIGAAGIFALIRTFQSTEKKHSRKAMLELHRRHPKHRWHPRLQ
jgi:magnesium-transporting ATPase (P-type)